MNNEQPAQPDRALDTLFWRDEILQVMFWLQGEGLAESVVAEDLLAFLNDDLNAIQFHLQQAAADGYLVRHPGTNSPSSAARYSLSDLGRKEGARRFADEFAGMQKSGHGECSADCECHRTGNRADCPSHNH